MNNEEDDYCCIEEQIRHVQQQQQNESNRIVILLKEKRLLLAEEEMLTTQQVRIALENEVNALKSTKRLRERSLHASLITDCVDIECSFVRQLQNNKKMKLDKKELDKNESSDESDKEYEV